MELLTITEVAEIMRVSVGIARKLVSKVPCVNYGRGRGRGKRWIRDDIETLLKEKRGEKKQAQSAPQSVPVSSLAMLSATDVFALTQPRVLQ